ncbi:MAG: carbohydrate ABC transporter permease [Anaerolineales bacterium]|nr:carbohydrate ABC transporter permease [Anaerolineales bacterium]
MSNLPIKTTDSKEVSKISHFSSFKLFFRGMRAQTLLAKGSTTLILAVGAVVIMIPFLFMISTSLKDRNQLRAFPPPLIPYEQTMVEVNGKEEPLYKVYVEGQTLEMALIKNRPEGKGLFVDPDNLGAPIELVIAKQEAVRHVEIHWENYKEALTTVPFLKYLINTLIIIFLSLVGTLLSSSLVAYGFARYRAPGMNVLFIVLLGTIMLPGQVTLLPTYVLFQKLGWVDTLKPLIVPNFFANAFNVFLLRQFFMTIPVEMDEAAKIDGASPLQILFHIILPQSKPVIAAIAVFHFLYHWNDFFEPLIYLHSQENWTMAIGLQTFSALYSVNTHLIMAASVIMVIPPVILFFLAQRVFMQGVVVSGIKG